MNDRDIQEIVLRRLASITRRPLPESERRIMLEALADALTMELGRIRTLLLLLGDTGSLN